MGLRRVSPCCIGSTGDFVQRGAQTAPKMGGGPWGRMVDHISSKLAFFPPRPATYELKEHLDGARELYIQPSLQCAPLPMLASCVYMLVR